MPFPGLSDLLVFFELFDLFRACSGFFRLPGLSRERERGGSLHHSKETVQAEPLFLFTGFSSFFCGGVLSLFRSGGWAKPREKRLPPKVRARKKGAKER